MAQIILISAMRCNFKKEIRMEKMNVKPATLGFNCENTLQTVIPTTATGMKNMNIIICDDRIDDRKNVSDLLSDYKP